MKSISKSEAIVTSSLIVLIASILLILLLSGCTFERIEGNYDLTTEDRPVSNFDEIISSGSFRVYIEYDSLTSVEVRAESNIQPYVYTIADGNTLRIGFKNGYNIRENYPVEVYVRTPHAKILRLQGSGMIECLGFTEESAELDLSGSGKIISDYSVSRLNASVSGSGNISLSGNAGNGHFRVSGSGIIRALDMPMETCEIHISGSGDIYAAVSDQLEATISGSGCIYYTGDPDIESNISGSGRIRKY